MIPKNALPRLAGLMIIAIPLSGWVCRPPNPSSIPATTLKIDSPAANTSYGNGANFTFQATATDNSGISLLNLEAGGAGSVPATLLLTCDAPDESWGLSASPATCAFAFAIDSNTDLISDGTLLLTAKATDRANHVTTATVTVNVKALTCSFIEPGTNAAVANVGSISAVVVQAIEDASPLKSVVVTGDNGNQLLNWPTDGFADAGSEPGVWDISSEVNTWSSEVGVGMHKLTAICTDNAGDVDSDTLDVNVGCGSDSDCPSGDRCCSQDGKCYPVVAEGADCDCQHPCPSDEGCFPGVCDATPQKCRPGCFPGSDMPPPYGTAPASCASQEGLLSFCNNLPADQVTPQNMGGACAVGDNCNVITQNCPNLPLNRAEPATLVNGVACTTLSSSCPNPTVPQNCVPLAPGVNGCVPAGPIPSGGTGCNQTCGQTAGNCVAGTWCTQPVDDNGNPMAPPTCSPQCATPTTNPDNSAGCPAGMYCDGIFGLGMVAFSTGVCQ